LRQTLAQQVWSALKPEERALATKAAAGYGRWLKAQRKPPNVLGAHLFLKEPDAWPQYADKAAPAERLAVAADSREGRAYRNLRRLGGAVSPMVLRDGSYSLSRPLTPAELAFADLPSEKDWPLITDRQQLASWLQFFSDAFPDVARRQIVTDHKTDAGSVRVFKMPWPWPPTKDGRTSTAPPSAA
jgi:hypothetical protein